MAADAVQPVAFWEGELPRALPGALLEVGDVEVASGGAS